MRKIAIIGSNSFLAKHLTERLKNQTAVEIVGFSRTNRNAQVDEWIPFDYPKIGLDLQQLLQTDAVIYCAGSGIQSSQYSTLDDIYSINTSLPVSIFNYLKGNSYSGVFISFGSYFEIGQYATDKVFTESEVALSPLQVPNDYCLSKRMLTRFMLNEHSDINYYHFILPTIYGRYENSNRLIPYILSCGQRNETPKLSSGVQVRQYLHIYDFVDLLWLILQKSNHVVGIYNVPAMNTLTIRKLVEIMVAAQPTEIDLNWGGTAKRDEVMKYLKLESKKLKQYLPDWEPSVSLAEGINSYKIAYTHG